jgi:nitrate/TMAO reductase-like tetraheme cytochrome c subunit
MLKNQTNSHRGWIAACLLIGLSVSVAQADDDDGAPRENSKTRHSQENRGKNLPSAPVNAKFKAECSSCHIAYPAELLPAESWRKLMSGLDKHFGSDASLTAAENKEITDFLVSNASNRWNSSTAPLRITETDWFKRKHDSREIAPSVWKNPKVKSQANCSACHAQAERGDFNEDDVKIPR